MTKMAATMSLDVSQSIALNRFGLGARPDSLRPDSLRVGFDAKQWLRDQCRPYSTQPLIRAGLPASATLSPRRKGKSGKERRALYHREMIARYHQQIEAEDGFRERMVRFWSNHFTVSWLPMPPLLSLVGAFEREAIRPHVMGKFEDLLLAATRHPAMLVYLNNRTSIGPNARAGRVRKKGLNENHAREIMELHTLGVDGGYSQEDVIALAKMLTGWTTEKDRAVFRFEPRMHEPGTQPFMGKRYSQNGALQGQAALLDLARHPATAQFIATKLARHFEQDDPSPSLVAHLRNVFLSSQGNLAELSAALIEAPSLWQPNLRKFKTPEELLISALRAVGSLNKMPDEALLQSAKLLGQMPFYAPSPQGWPDRAEQWVGPAAVKARLDWANRLAETIPVAMAPSALAQNLMGPLVSARTIRAIGNAENPRQALTLLLMSPEFQRR